MSKPIKRHSSLQPLSREHHHSLLLCWKIRTGFKKGVDVKRMKRYVDLFFIDHIQPHFELEEKYVFPILGNDHELVKKALTDHRRLFRLFNTADELEKSLGLIEEELEKHIRFEERVLFNEIQQVASAEQMRLITEMHAEEVLQEEEEDEFWK
jgi:iron-sulfur cluster repair protein YtfE (RIC family)